MKLSTVTGWITEHKFAYFEKNEEVYILKRQDDEQFIYAVEGDWVLNPMPISEIEQTLFYVDPGCHKLITQNDTTTIYEVIEYLKQSCHNVLYFTDLVGEGLFELSWVYNPGDFRSGASIKNPDLGYRIVGEEHEFFEELTNALYLHELLDLPSRLFMDRELTIPFDKTFKDPIFEVGDIVKVGNIIAEIHFVPVSAPGGWLYELALASLKHPVEEKHLKLVCKKANRKDAE